MCKITMLARTTRRWLWRLQLIPSIAVDGERESTAGASINVFIKDKSIRAEMLRHHSVVAFIIAIALQGICEEPVIFRTL